MILLIALAMTAPAAPLGAAPMPGSKIKTYLAPVLRLYDENDVAIPMKAKGALPMPASIERCSAKGKPGVLVDGTYVFLRPSDIETIGGCTKACIAVAAAPASTPGGPRTGRQIPAVSDVGASAGIGSAGTRCY